MLFSGEGGVSVVREGRPRMYLPRDSTSSLQYLDDRKPIARKIPGDLP